MTNIEFNEIYDFMLNIKNLQDEIIYRQSKIIQKQNEIIEQYKMNDELYNDEKPEEERKILEEVIKEYEYNTKT